MALGMGSGKKEKVWRRGRLLLLQGSEFSCNDLINLQVISFWQNGFS